MNDEEFYKELVEVAGKLTYLVTDVLSHSERLYIPIQRVREDLSFLIAEVERETTKEDVFTFSFSELESMLHAHYDKGYEDAKKEAVGAETPA